MIDTAKLRALCDLAQITAEHRDEVPVVHVQPRLLLSVLDEVDHLRARIQQAAAEARRGIDDVHTGAHSTAKFSYIIAALADGGE